MKIRVRGEWADVQVDRICDLEATAVLGEGYYPIEVFGLQPDYKVMVPVLIKTWSVKRKRYLAQMAHCRWPEGFTGALLVTHKFRDWAYAVSGEHYYGDSYLFVRWIERLGIQAPNVILEDRKRLHLPTKEYHTLSKALQSTANWHGDVPLEWYRRDYHSGRYVWEDKLDWAEKEVARKQKEQEAYVTRRIAAFQPIMEKLPEQMRSWETDGVSTVRGLLDGYPVELRIHVTPDEMPAPEKIMERVLAQIKKYGRAGIPILSEEE